MTNWQPQTSGEKCTYSFCRVCNLCPEWGKCDPVNVKNICDCCAGKPVSHSALDTIRGIVRAVDIETDIARAIEESEIALNQYQL